MESVDVTRASDHILGGRLRLLRACVAAVDQFEDAQRVIAGTANPEAARDALRAALHIDDLGARAVLDLRWVDLTTEKVAALRAELVATETELNGRGLTS